MKLVKRISYFFVIPIFFLSLGIFIGVWGIRFFYPGSYPGRYSEVPADRADTSEVPESVTVTVSEETLCADTEYVLKETDILLLRLHPLVINSLTLTDMTKRNSKTVAQQCRYYEVDNIFVYMVETYINGNFETFRRLYHELNKDARRDFMDFLLSEVEPTYWRERLKQTI